MLKRIYGVQLVDYYRLIKADADTTAAAPRPGEKETPKTLEALANSDSYYVVKTHEMPQEDYPALYLVRDGRDSLVSYTHYAMEYEGKSKLFQKVFFRRTLRNFIEQDHFGGWSSNVLAWTQRSTPTAIVKFEDLIVDPIGTLTGNLGQLDYHLPAVDNPEVPSFEALRKANPFMYRKGQVGGWRKEMPDKLHDLFWERHGAAMDLMDYRRD